MDKKNNNKGFTLIEILAAVTILAIISTVVVVSVVRYINKSRNSVYETMEKSICDAASNYVINENLETEVTEAGDEGITYEGKKLMADKYLENLTDPRNKKKNCKASVNIKVLNSDDSEMGISEYAYNVKLKCSGYSSTVDFTQGCEVKNRTVENTPDDTDDDPIAPDTPDPSNPEADNTLLYNIVANETKGLDTDVSFKFAPTVANSGVYTRVGTETGQYPVHYYRGIIDNNYVFFAGICWKMVRTTDTGGVKLIYNGFDTVPLTKNKYISISNDPVYPYSYNSTTNKWISTNKDESTTSTISFSVSEPGNYVLSYKVSSEKSCDVAHFYKDNVEIGTVSGFSSRNISLGELTSSNVIMIKYTKNNNFVSSGSDEVAVSLNKVTGDVSKSCNTTGEDTQIGKNSFNFPDYYLSSVGYMYGTKQFSSSYSLVKVSVLKEFNSSSNYYYGSSVVYSNGRYTLRNATQKNWSTNYNKLHGYYTCRSTSNTCTTVYYIVDGTSSWQYVLPLSNGATDPSTQTITLGKDVIDNGNGTYSLSEPVVVEKKNWYSTYDKYKNYYVCSDLNATTCTNKYLIVDTSPSSLVYDQTFNYVYGNDVVWDGSKYTLIDTFTSTNSWSTDRTELAKKYHYTCFNTSGECSNVFYIYDFTGQFGNNNFSLSNGMNIENFIGESFANRNSSDIKLAVDDWYKDNLIDYTSKLEDTIWCNDRSFYGSSLAGKDSIATTSNRVVSERFSFINRLVLGVPSVVCPNVSRDGFTVSISSGGNGALTYPIGLLTADEMQMAGGTGTSINNYYLYTGEIYYSMSPGYFDGSPFIFVNYNFGSNLVVNALFGDRGVRPAISLAYGARAVSGNGTADNPYIVE